MPSSLRRPATLALAIIGIAALAGSPSAGRPDNAEAPPLVPRRPDLTDPVVCASVHGFRDYVARESAELSRDEKLQIYYEPFNYLVVRDAPSDTEDGRPSYRAHLTQDARLRKAGSKTVIQEQHAAIDYTPKAHDPPTTTYMLYLAELKHLAPGDYEIDLVLRDELASDKPETVTTVAFRLLPPAAHGHARRSR